MNDRRGVTRTLIAAFASVPQRSPVAVAALGRLTEREREITALAAYGLENTRIADRLVISPATVKAHIARAMTKVNARDRAQLVVFAYQVGLVRPAGPWSFVTVRRSRGAVPGARRRCPRCSTRPRRPSTSGRRS